VGADDEPVAACGLGGEPLDCERWPLERMGDDQVVEHGRILLPVQVPFHLLRRRRCLGRTRRRGAASHLRFAREVEAVRVR
jgi:hypothetical protein